MADRSRFDCQTCGACCTNPEENRQSGFVDYVEVRPRDAIRKNDALMESLVRYDHNDIPHLKMAYSGTRCVALEGRVGKSVGCSIYEWRPWGCRKVQPGDWACLRARRERGIDRA